VQISRHYIDMYDFIDFEYIKATPEEIAL